MQQNLENYSSELVRFIEDLRKRREQVNKEILKQEREKDIIQKYLNELPKKLNSLNISLSLLNGTRSDYDKTIHESEAEYHKILQSSQNLLEALKRESVNLEKKRCQEKVATTLSCRYCSSENSTENTPCFICQNPLPPGPLAPVPQTRKRKRQHAIASSQKKAKISIEDFGQVPVMPKLEPEKQVQQHIQSDLMGLDDDYPTVLLNVTPELPKLSAPGLPTCPGKHGLKRIVKWDLELRCSKCDKWVRSTTEIFSCRICDYHICGNCYRKELRAMDMENVVGSEVSLIHLLADDDGNDSKKENDARVKIEEEAKQVSLLELTGGNFLEDQKEKDNGSQAIGNQKLIEVFREFGDLSLKAGIEWRWKLCQRVITAVKAIKYTLQCGAGKRMSTKGKYRIRGIGKKTGKWIDEFLSTGKISKLEKLRRRLAQKRFASQFLG